MNVSGDRVSWRATPSLDESQFKGRVSNLVGELNIVRQSVSELNKVDISGLSNRKKASIARCSGALLVKMSDNLVLIQANKEYLAESSYECKKSYAQAFDIALEGIKADYKELKALKDNCLASMQPVSFAPETKEQDGGRVWVDKSREWK